MPVVVVPGGEFAVALCNRPRQVARSVLLPPPLIVLVLLRCRFRMTLSSAQALISDLPSTGSSPSSSAPFYPVLSLNSCHRQPLFRVRWPVGSFSAAALKAPVAAQPLFIVLSCVALLSSGPIGPWRSLCFLGARSSQALLQPSRSISSAHFLLLKAVVLAVADGRRPGRRAAAFPAWLMGIPSDARPTCFHHIERAVR